MLGKIDGIYYYTLYGSHLSHLFTQTLSDASNIPGSVLGAQEREHKWIQQTESLISRSVERECVIKKLSHGYIDNYKVYYAIKEKWHMYGECKKGSCLNFGMGILKRSLYWGRNIKDEFRAAGRWEQCSGREDWEVSKLCLVLSEQEDGRSRVMQNIMELTNCNFYSLHFVYWDSTCPSRPCWCLSYPTEQVCQLMPMPTSPFFDCCAHIIRTY